MDKHPIETLMTTTLENIREMVDVNTVVGEPVPTPDGSTVIPVSRVSFGFASGGGEYGSRRPAQPASELPFAGGSGAGVTVQPVGFLILGSGAPRMLPAQYAGLIDHVLESLPRLLSDAVNALRADPAQS